MPTGRFAVEGDFNPKSGAIEIKGVAWIDRPKNYGMVNLHGTLSGDGSAIDGKVEFPGCTSFHVAVEGAPHRSTAPKEGAKQGKAS